MDILNKAINKAIENGYDWRTAQYGGEIYISPSRKDGEWSGVFGGEYTVDTEVMLCLMIFDHKFAKALWGEDKYMAYYTGYDEWADATTPEDEYAEFDERQHERMPLWEYRTMMISRSVDRLAYLKKTLDS